MPIQEDKLKGGVLTLDAIDFAAQATSVEVEPTHDEDGDPIETLDGSTLAADVTRGDSLKITAIQDFTDVAGFVNFTWQNDLATVPFTWTPVAGGPSYSGNVQVRAVKVGGEVNKRITTEAEWTCEGPVIRAEGV
jgi:hypothetical protein